MESEHPAGPHVLVSQRVADGALERDAYGAWAVRRPRDAEPVHAGESGCAGPENHIHCAFRGPLFFCGRVVVLAHTDVANLEDPEEDCVFGRQAIAIEVLGVPDVRGLAEL